MFRLLKRLALFVVGVVALAAGLLLLGPRERIERGAPVSIEGRGIEEVLAEREAAFTDITPGTAAQVIWAAEPDTRTPLSILYLHGFSATSEEIRPVPDRVAEALGANLIYARLTGHGRDGDALAVATASDWADDAALFLDLARQAGERVLIIGTSTGATLAAYAMTEADMAQNVAGLVMVSPNFQVANRSAAVTELAFARQIVPMLAGEERAWDALNEDHARFWTTRYGTGALISLGTLMRETRARDYSGVSAPVLALYSERDQVVSAAATRDFLAGWGGLVALAPQELPAAGADPYFHVIAGDILSPAMTAPVAREILDWVERALP